MNIHIENGDITEKEFDVIVSSANPYLGWGGGVCGAIFRNAGEEYETECQKIMKERLNKPLDIAEVVITPGFNLKSKFVFHTVGVNISRGEDINLVEKCYLNCIKKAEDNKLSSIAFPAISTGILGLDINDSAKIIKKLLLSEDIKQLNYLKDIYFILYKEEDYKIYKETL